MKVKDIFSLGKKAMSIQTARYQSHPYKNLLNYTPLAAPDYSLYTAMREGIPIIDAAIDKIIRLTIDFKVTCADPQMQSRLDDFISNVNTGACTFGLRQFITSYFDSLITYGNAIGEIIPSTDGRDIYALYNAKISDIAITSGRNSLDSQICTLSENGTPVPVQYPQFVLFTPLNPPSGEIRGVSLLRSLPFVADILMTIFESTGTNFERAANLRYAVTYNPGSSNLDKAYAKDIAAAIAQEWSDAMSSSKNGTIKDFVAVGDVDIKVIGCDNQMMDTEIPVRQILEQIVAKLGIPPFMLGLHWSSTERMSSQQADILTSELESYRRVLESVIMKICNMWLRLKGCTAGVEVTWGDINLQDQLEAANAKLINAQADELLQQLKK